MTWRLSAVASLDPLPRPAQPVAWQRGNEATIYVYDRISNQLGAEYHSRYPGVITPQSVLGWLSDAEGATVLHIRINSPGGDWQAAKAIAQHLREFPARKVIHIDGQAASAAAYLAAAVPAEVRIAPEGTVMIHGVRFGMVYDATAGKLREAADLADLETDAMVEILAQRTRQPKAKVREWTSRDTYFRAAEALEAGLVDVVEELKPQPRALSPARRATPAPAFADRAIEVKRVVRVATAARLVARVRRARLAAGGAM